MRIAIFLASMLFICDAEAASLPGVYVIETPQGRIVAKLEVKGEKLTGSIDFGGKTEIKLAGTTQGDAASGTASSKDGAGSFEAVVQGDTLNLTVSQQDGPNQKAAQLPLQFQRLVSKNNVPERPATAEDSAGDPRLVGNWTYQNVIASGDASFASEEHMALRADGTYLYRKGRTAAGGDDWSFEGGNDGKAESGRWRAQNGILFVMGSHGGEWTRVGKYGMTSDGKTMRITYERGNRKLWSR